MRLFVLGSAPPREYYRDNIGDHFTCLMCESSLAREDQYVHSLTKCKWFCFYSWKVCDSSLPKKICLGFHHFDGPYVEKQAELFDDMKSNK